MEVDQEIQLTVIKTVNEESSGSLQIAKIRSLKCQYFFKLFSLDHLQLLNIQIFFILAVTTCVVAKYHRQNKRALVPNYFNYTFF